MKRVEIIGNRSIEEDLFEVFPKDESIIYYTKIPVVHGLGSSGPRLGDNIWPEENFMLIIYCTDMVASKIKLSVEELKKYFINEGIKMFETELICSV